MIREKGIVIRRVVVTINEFLELILRSNLWISQNDKLDLLKCTE